MTILPRSGAALLILFATTHAALATFPPEELDCGVFDYSDPNFSPHENAFASKLDFSWPAPTGGTDTLSTGLNGFQVSAEELSQVTPPPGDPSGQEIPLNGTAFTDLFPSTPAPQARNSWVSQSVYTAGDFQTGLSEFSIRQRKVVEVEQTDPTGGFADIFGVTKGYTVFGVEGGGDGSVDANLNVRFDGVVETSGSGGGSEGFDVFLLDVTDPEAIEVIALFFGFYATDPNSGLFYDLQMGDGDPMNNVSLNDNFSFNDDGQGNAAPDFTYELPVSLQQGKDYGLGVATDASSFVLNGLGGAKLQLDFTFEVGVSLDNAGDQIVVPGLTSTIPEPSSAVLLVLSGLACGFRRR